MLLDMYMTSSWVELLYLKSPPGSASCPRISYHNATLHVLCHNVLHTGSCR